MRYWLLVSLLSLALAPLSTAGDDPACKIIFSDDPAGLKERAQKMLDMQKAVHNDTVALAKVIKGAPKDRQAFLKLSQSEKEIVVEATKTLDMLKEEGVAVAFVEFFKQLREDMMRVQRRLQVSDIGTETQTSQTEIIDSLKEMIESLSKR